ncbi:MAG: phospholipid carrier-dependent glycosyltransferase [Candidatus Kerfeldbacteria bacterium]|nr:phospholipid carrier-dependent glycosyltransferase [Candidatus Kerfeldbacteria bacterium]
MKELVNFMSLPWWTLQWISAIVLLFAMYRATRSQSERFPFFTALAFFPGLTLYEALILWHEPLLQSQHFLLTVAWAACIAQIVFSAKPEWRFSVKQWRWFAAVLLCITAVLAGVIRFFPTLFLTSSLFVLFIVLWMLILRFVPLNMLEHVAGETPKPLRQQWYWVIAIGIIILCAGWVRIASLNAFPFQNDEFFHLETAKGYVETGRYVQWNFLTQQPQEVYTRAWPYTWQVAQSAKFFGFSEWSLRLPALVWGMLFLILVPFVAYSWTRRASVAFTATLIAAFDPSLIWSSSYTRMYSMFWTLSLFTVWCFWKAVHEKEISVKSQHSAQRWVWLFVSGVAACASAFIHEAGLLLFAGMGVTIVVLWLREPKNRYYRVLTFCFCAGVVAVFTAHVIHPFLPLGFITLRQHPAFSYMDYLFGEFLLPWFALLITVAFLFFTRAKRLPYWVIIASSFGISLTGYFVYFANRYAVRKYSFFFIMPVFIVFAYAWEQYMQYLFPQSAKPWLRRTLSILLFVWLAIPLSFPGIPESFLFTTARADKSYTEIEYYNYPVAYAYLEEHAEPNATVLMLSPQTYYLHRTDLHIQRLPLERALTVEELKSMLAASHSGWMVLPKYKQYHLNPAVKNYIQKHLRLVNDDPNTNMLIYQW